MYEALGIMVNKTGNSLGPYGTYMPVGGYGKVLGGDKTLRRKIKPEMDKGHVVEEVDGNFNRVVREGFRE